MDTLPSTHYQSPSVIRFNQEARAAGHGMTLATGEMLQVARDETGLHDFGNPDFLPALHALVDGINGEAQLNPFGLAVARSHTLRSLKNRLWAQAAFDANPAIRERKIRAPIVIIGPHRSGTTRLQRMLAADSRLVHLQAWEGLHPAPRMDEPDMGKAARFAEAARILDSRKEYYPGAYHAHPMAAHLPEEDALLLNHAFCGFLALGQYTMPDYARAFVDADRRHGYQAMADLLRLISWQRGDADGCRVVLKNPQHMLDLELLLEIFPDAKLVFMHRDPLKTVGSMMSLMWSYAVQHTDMPCRARIRDIWLALCEQMARRAMDARHRIAASRQIDVYYHEMNRDWITTMRRIYDFAGLEFTPDAEQAMASWLAASEKEQAHAAHRYSLADFGLTDAEVDERFAFVRRQYDIPYEASR